MNKTFALSLIIFLSLCSTVQAHFGGFTYETTVGDYFIDIGAGTPALTANELTLFDFNIHKQPDLENLADFDNVYVTIGDDQEVKIATFVYRPPDHLTVLSYSFQKPGKYEISARFSKGSVKMAEVSFPVEVSPKEALSRETKISAASVVLGVVVGILIGLGVALRRKVV